MTEHDLTLKQTLFIQHYLGDSKGNGTEAARRAGYGGDERTLAAIASENLAKPQIAARIAARIDDLGITTDMLLRELADIAFSAWSEHITVRTRAHGVVEVRMDLKDKVRALELLMKHKGMLSKKLIVNAKVRHEHGHGITPEQAVELLALIEGSGQLAESSEGEWGAIDERETKVR